MSRRQLNLPPSTAKNALIRHKSFWSDHTFQPGAGPSKEYWTLPFTKDKGASESYIHVHGIMCGEGASSYPYIGMYVTIDQHGRTDNEHDSAGGIYYCGPDGNQIEKVISASSIKYLNVLMEERILTLIWTILSHHRVFYQQVVMILI